MLCFSAKRKANFNKLERSHAVVLVVLSFGSRSWLIVFILLGGLFLFFNQRVKKNPFAVKNILLLPIQNFRNGALWNICLFTDRGLRVANAQQVKDFFFKGHHCLCHKFDSVFLLLFISE